VSLRPEKYVKNTDYRYETCDYKCFLAYMKIVPAFLKKCAAFRALKLFMYGLRLIVRTLAGKAENAGNAIHCRVFLTTLVTAATGISHTLKI